MKYKYAGLAIFVIFLFAAPAAAVVLEKEVVIVPNKTFSGFTEYVVIEGETLALIAQKFDVSIKEILKANPEIFNRHLIIAGSGLRIPLKEPPVVVDVAPPSLPPVIFAPPEVIKDVVKEAVPLIVENFPKEMDVSQKSLNQIEVRVKNIVDALKVKGSQSGITIMESPLRHWLILLLALAALIVLLILIFLALKRRKKASNILEKEVVAEKVMEPAGEKREPFVLREMNVNTVHAETLKTDKIVVPAKTPAAAVKNNLSLSPNAGRKDFEKWLEAEKKIHPDKEIECFRCRTLVKPKNMKSHIFNPQKCKNQPEWAKKDEEVQLESGKKYGVKP